MAEVLSQSEIEALLTSMTTITDDAGVVGIETDAAAPSSNHGIYIKPSPKRVNDIRVFLPLSKRKLAAAGNAFGDPHIRLNSNLVSYESYDFRRPDKLSKEHLRSLQIVHEAFANHFSSSLSGYLRTQVQIELVSVEQVPYDEYMKSISASLLNILNVSPLSGQLIYELDFAVLFSMIERLLGGKGAPTKMFRDLTDIERMLADNIVAHALDDLKTVWAAVTPLEFDVESTETSSQFIQIVPGNDTCVLVLFEMRMGDFQGAMSICIPYLLIKPILSKLSSQRWLTKASKKTSSMYATQLTERLRTTKVPCIARLGTAALTVGELDRLRVGDVVPIVIPGQEEESGKKNKIATVDLVIGNVVKFRGRTGLNGRKLAVQIEQVIAAIPDLIAHKDTE